MDRFSALERQIPSLRRYAHALLRGREDADDLVQGSLLRAIERMETRNSEGDLRAWLFAIMHNLFVNQWRSRRVRDAALVQDSTADAVVPAGQEDALALRDLLRRLDHLTEEQRVVLLLVAVEGFDYATTARTLGIPVGTVMSRLSRARDRLRALDAERPALRSVT